MLKTGGSQVEKLQWETFARLERAIALDTLIAWRILWMTYQGRQDPDQSCAVAVTAEAQRAVWLVHERRRPRNGPRPAIPADPSHYARPCRRWRNSVVLSAGTVMATRVSTPCGEDFVNGSESWSAWNWPRPTTYPDRVQH